MSRDAAPTRFRSRGRVRVSDERFIDEVFTRTETTEFVGSVRCMTLGAGMFTGMAVELDTSN